MSLFVKDPEATLDYVFDWTQWLASGETINSATVTAPAGITVAPEARTTVVDQSKVTAWLGGGVDGQTYAITCRVDTSAGRTDDRTIRVRVMHR